LSLFDQSDVDEEGLHILHGFDELAVPLLTSAPLIQHPLWQVPPLHTWPVPQVTPLALTVHEVVAYAVWHVWQAFDGLAAALA
jgi:hypothetical protein